MEAGSAYEKTCNRLIMLLYRVWNDTRSSSTCAGLGSNGSSSAYRCRLYTCVLLMEVYLWLLKLLNHLN